MAPRRLARYPYVKEASAYLRERGVLLSDLLRDDAYRRARGRGLYRVLVALERGGRAPPPAPPPGRGGAPGDPRVPRRADDRLVPRGPVPDPPVRADGGGVGPGPPRTGGRAVHRVPRAGARPRPAALGRGVPGPLHGLPPAHEHDAGEGLEADQPDRGPRVRPAPAGAGAAGDAERGPAADRERAPASGERRGDRGPARGGVPGPPPPRRAGGAVQGGGGRAGRVH